MFCNAVTYTDDSEVKVTVAYTDSQRLNDFVAIMDQQEAAAKTNKDAAGRYNEAADSAQVSIIAGRPALDLPPAPKMLVVADSGVKTNDAVSFLAALAVAVPARRAMVTDPVRALRYE
jgi:hypothetical protein